MPLANLDYDYYEYVNGQRTNRASYTTATRRTASATNTRRPVNTQYQRTSTARNLNTAKKNVTSTKQRAVTKQVKKQPTRKVATNNNPTKKYKHNIDIPITSNSNIKNKPKEMELKKPKAATSTLTLKEAFIRTFYVIVFLAVGLAICYRYSLINEKYAEIKNLKKEYENIQTVNTQIQADIDSKTDLTYIENYAKYQLGMQKPSNSQLKYISIEKQDKTFAPVKVEEENSVSWFEKVCLELKKIID